MDPSQASVRRLARDLARDDAVQDAWLTALRKGIGGPSLGRWIALTARRIAGTQRRADSRRREHEERAGRADPEPAALETAAHLELVKRLVAAVEELEEPFRTAIVLRYLEDEPPRRIARRLGVPVDTVRSRVRRGLERLRERLDRKSFLTLAPLSLVSSGRRRASAPSGPVLAGGALACGTAIVLLAGILDEPGRAHEPALAAAESGPAASAAGTRALGPVRVDAASRTGRTAPADPEDARVVLAQSVPDGASALSAPAPARVRGRVLEANGRPARAVIALDMDLLTGEALALDETTRRGILDGWSFAPVETGEDGRFELELRPTPGFGYSLSIDRAPSRSWPIVGLAEGEARELGDIALVSCAVSGRLTDAEGRVLAQAGWQVSARTESPEDAGEWLDAWAPVDALTGTFVLDDLVPGRIRLAAFHALALADPASGPELEVAAGETAHADVVYAGPDVARAVIVTVELASGSSAVRPAPASVRLVTPGARARTASGDRPFRFDGVADGEHALVIDDPRFLPWRREGVRPGTHVRAELAGSATLVVSAHDHATGEPVRRFAVWPAPAIDRFATVDEPLHDGATELAGGRLAGLVPGPIALRVLAEGYAPERVELELAPGETRAIELALGPGAAVSGRARFADGTPAAGATLSLLVPATDADDPRGRVLRLGELASPGAARTLRRELARTTCDAAGAFRFALETPGVHLVAVLPATAGAPYASLRFHAGEDEHVEGLDLVLPGGSR